MRILLYSGGSIWIIMVRKLPILIMTLLIFSVTGNPCISEESPPIPPDSGTYQIKAGDQTMMNAVFLATGPGLVIPDYETSKSWSFLSAEESSEEYSLETMSGIFSEGYIEYDSALYSNYGIPGIESPYCSNYALVCPGTYTYDQNGVRIDYSGGGDSQYREYCCGDFPWTPLYKKPENVSGGNT